MSRWHGCWLLVSLWLPTELPAQEWRPASTLPTETREPAISMLGKPMTARSVITTKAEKEPGPPELERFRHQARRPEELGSVAPPQFAPPAVALFQARYQTPMTAEEQFNCGVIPGPASSVPPPGVVPPPPPGAVPPPPGSTHPFQGIKDCWNRIWHPGAPGSTSGTFGSWDCRSDHAFDGFISPVSNPAFFEDPRSLTEIRPIFIYQKAPSDNPLLVGGNMFVLNLQGRISINDRWSIVLNRLGLARVDPGDGAIDGFTGGTGLTDLGIGTKYTFYRDDRANMLWAAGVNFDIPIGNTDVLSGTGAGVTPYLSFGKALGAWHILSTAGYRLGFSDSSSDFFFVSGHLDYGFFNRLYPLVEVNWFHYTSNGTKRMVDFEGADLFNLGATNASGSDIVTVALGLRYKFTEGFQTGIAYEFPVVGDDALQKYRITFDLIFRF